jgi:hypothetical protein
MATYSIEAPDDAFVTFVLPDGAVVQKQAKVITFRSPNLERLKASLDALRDHIAIIERPFADRRLKAEIQALADRRMYYRMHLIQRPEFKLFYLTTFKLEKSLHKIMKEPR